MSLLLQFQMRWSASGVCAMKENAWILGRKAGDSLCPKHRRAAGRCGGATRPACALPCRAAGLAGDPIVSKTVPQDRSRTVSPAKEADAEGVRSRPARPRITPF